MRSLLPYAHQPWLDGFWGALFALAPLALPLPMLPDQDCQNPNTWLWTLK